MHKIKEMDTDQEHCMFSKVWVSTDLLPDVFF